MHPCSIDEKIAETVRSLPVPCVFMDTYTDSTWQPPSVCISNSQGMHRVVRHLKELGHRRIGYVSSGWESLLNLERRRCFREAMRDFGLCCSENDFFTAGEESGLVDYTSLSGDFGSAGSLPTAMVCENDRQAWRTIMALQAVGKRVPEDVSVVGFDDGAICTTIEPNITTIHNSPQLMGRHRRHPELPVAAQGAQQHVPLAQPPTLEQHRRLGAQPGNLPKGQGPGRPPVVAPDHGGTVWVQRPQLVHHVVAIVEIAGIGIAVTLQPPQRVEVLLNESCKKCPHVAPPFCGVSIQW